MVDARPARRQVGDVDLTEARAEVGDVRRARGVHDRSSGSGAAPRTQRVGVANLAVADACGVDLAHLDQEGEGRAGASTGPARPRGGAASNVALFFGAWNDASIEKITSPSWTARTWRAENEPPSRSRST